MADIQVNSNVGIDGNSYTTAISNDQLSNDDFLKLMIQELKLQDPTKPMDSAKMLSTQMQMSTISTNQEMIKAMQSMQTAFSQTAISNAAGIIGKNIEDGNVGEDGITKAYTVRSIENVDGEIQVKAQQILYLEDRVILQDPTDATKNQIVDYNVNGEILDEKGISAEVVHVPTIKPLDTETILSSARKTGRTVSAEEAQISGGFGSAISELLSERMPTPLMRLGIEDRFGESGEPMELFDFFGLTGEHLAEKIEKYVHNTPQYHRDY